MYFFLDEVAKKGKILIHIQDVKKIKWFLNRYFYPSDIPSENNSKK